MKTLTVDLGERSYPIYIGQDTYARSDLLSPHIPGKQVLIVSNETVAPLYLQKLQDALKDFTVDSLILPDGEQYKTIDIMGRIFDRLLQKHFNRSATLIALGGGVIGDITGFAAACYQRGVHFIQIPTTLLAQVDSSVGGKTGVNHPLGKNMIGAFYQPRCVLADTATLNTLDKRQFSAGLAEVIKYGLIRDAEFFQWIKAHVDQLMSRDNDALIYAIERSCQNKAEVVAADEREGGQRALLNLGHTFGHAIETGTGYGTWLHGEGVAAGMLMAAQLSHDLGWLAADEMNSIREVLQQCALPVMAPAEMSTTQFLELMAVDKKVLDGKIRFVVLKGIGHSLVTDEIDPLILHRMLDHFPRLDSKSLAQ